jgi:hypothetical protein
MAKINMLTNDMIFSTNFGRKKEITRIISSSDNESVNEDERLSDNENLS